MANTLITKNSSTAAAIPTAGQLVQGELAVNVTDKRVFTENAAGAVVELGTNPSSIATGVITTTADASVQGLTVGRGAGAVSTNTAVGASALAANTSGFDSTGAGYFALKAQSGANGNTGFGRSALELNVSGSSNTGVGAYALGVGTAGDNNSAFGKNALYTNTGSFNTALGAQALQLNTTASNNTAVGYQAGYSNSTGVYTTALGERTLYSNNANYNTAVGSMALYANTTGTNNIAVGGTNGAYSALRSSTTGSYNTALGNAALANNTTASENTAVGYQALYTGTTFAGLGANVALGYQAGYVNNNYSNVFIGHNSALASTGYGNTFVGQASGNTVTSGAANTIIGRYNGNNGGLDIRTANNHIVLSDGDGNPRGIFDANGNFRVGTTAYTIASNRAMTVFGAAGIEAVATGATGEPCVEMWQQHTSGDNVFSKFYTESTAVLRGSISYNRSSGVTAYNTTSDYRTKDISGPVTDSGALIDSTPVYMGKMKGAIQERPMFIAHEVPPYAHTGEKDAVDVDGNPVYQQMDASALVPVMWAEIQSLRQRLAAAGI
tara:strand:+ start:885 stop:2546 length:1662 start_codon:yes stop_codon:yes gene_type:complete